jgi:nitrogen fixation protein FixH
MTSHSAFTIKGWHVLAAVSAFFALVIGVDATMITLAYRSFPGQSAANPYEAGIAFNASLAQRSRENALGWRVEAAAIRDGVVVEVQDRAGAPLSALQASATLTRPATESGAEHIVLRPAGHGVYVGPGPTASGAWDLSVTVRDASGHEVQAQRRLTWR